MVLKWLGGSKDAGALYPHVRQVLEEFYLARALNTAEGT
jgi:hypothetical protein